MDTDARKRCEDRFWFELIEERKDVRVIFLETHLKIVNRPNTAKYYFHRMCILMDVVMKWENRYQQMVLAECLALHCIQEYMIFARLVPDLLDVMLPEGERPLHIVAKYHPHYIPRMLELGADVNVLSNSLWTALDYLYHVYPRDLADHIPEVVSLLKNGASTMFGKRDWLHSAKPFWRDTSLPSYELNRLHQWQRAKIIRRCHYLSLLFRIQLLTEHKRVLIEMLV